jgi:hypothetical protein
MADDFFNFVNSGVGGDGRVRSMRVCLLDDTDLAGRGADSEISEFARAERGDSLCDVAQIETHSTPMPDDPGQPPTLGKHGGKRIKGQQGASGSTLKRGSTSVDYILARLEREGLTHWIEAIHARQVSAFAVACELGWARRPQTLHEDNQASGYNNQARLRRHAIVDVKSLIG